MSLSSHLRQAVYAGTLATLGTQQAAAESHNNWDASVFYELEGASDFVLSAPTDLLVHGSFLDQYYPENVYIEEHRTSTQSIGFRLSREWEQRPGADGFFTRSGGSLRYSHSTGYVVLGTDRFVDHVASGISSDIYDVWSRYSGSHSGLLTESDINRAVRQSADVILNYLADNPDISFDAGSVQIPDNVPEEVRPRLRSALDEVEARADHVTSSTSFENLLTFAGYYQDPVFDMTAHTLGIEYFMDVGYRDYVSNGIFGMQSYEFYAGLSAGYEANYIHAEGLGGTFCHGATAALRAGARANFEGSALSLHAQRPFDIDQECMGGAARGINGASEEWQFRLELSSQF